jgi:hypothetical protein
MTTDFTNCPFCGQPVFAEPKTQEEWLEMRRKEARDKSKLFENTPGVIDAGIVEGPVDFPVVSKLDDYEGD